MFLIELSKIESYILYNSC